MGVDETVEGMDLDILPVEDVQLIKCLVVVMLNFSSNQDVHQDCVNQGMDYMLV